MICVIIACAILESLGTAVSSSWYIIFCIQFGFTIIYTYEGEGLFDVATNNVQIGNVYANYIARSCWTQGSVSARPLECCRLLCGV